MKILLRSCFTVNPKTDDKTLFLRNFQLLREAELGFEAKEDNIIWQYVVDFVLSHNHVPDFTTLLSNFERKREHEVVNRLRALEVIQPITQGDFANRVEEKAEDRRKRLWVEILKEAGTITETGMEVVTDKKGSKKILRGPVDAAHHIVQRSYSIVAPTFGGALSGEVTSGGDAFKRKYDLIAQNPLAGIGLYTGLQQADQALKGAKKFELWVHAAFTGGMKSSFMLNWAYNLAIWYKHSSTIFSLEMPYDQVERMLYAIHSYHEKFKPIRYQLGLQRDPEADIGLSYEKIRDAQLSPAEYDFLFNHVMPDFNDPANHYGKINIEVADPDKIEYTVADLRHKAELLYSKDPYGVIFVDHVGLMGSRGRYSSTTEKLNEIIRDLKKLAMSFNRGQGIAVVALFQINREGYKAALKKKKDGGTAGYDLTHLSYANEAERSADIVTTTWLDDDLKKKNRVQFQCLKARDTAGFEPFLARVEWLCRKLLTCYDPVESGTNQSMDNPREVQDAIDNLAGTL